MGLIGTRFGRSARGHIIGIFILCMEHQLWTEPFTILITLMLFGELLKYTGNISIAKEVLSVSYSSWTKSDRLAKNAHLCHLMEDLRRLIVPAQLKVEQDRQIRISQQKVCPKLSPVQKIIQTCRDESTVRLTLPSILNSTLTRLFQTATVCIILFEPHEDANQEIIVWFSDEEFAGAADIDEWQRDQDFTQGVELRNENDKDSNHFYREVRGVPMTAWCSRFPYCRDGVQGRDTWRCTSCPIGDPNLVTALLQPGVEKRHRSAEFQYYPDLESLPN
ncbi:hypothetical protein C8R45DRAFT_931985 [Mycena sanguinolenta]|nr:hypothetical protein C8R45DRAFT_931985 [Mycena sanguinolenta]